MNNSSQEKAYTRAIWMTILFAIGYGCAAIAYDFKLAVVYFGAITVGASAYGAIMTKLRIREEAVRELIEELRRSSSGTEPPGRSGD